MALTLSIVLNLMELDVIYSFTFWGSIMLINIYIYKYQARVFIAAIQHKIKKTVWYSHYLPSMRIEQIEVVNDCK